MDPIILPLAALVFACALMVYKYNVLCVYRERYDTGGLWVPVAAFHIHIVLGIYQVTMLGVLRGRMEEGLGTLFICAVIGGSIVANVRAYSYSEAAFNYSHLPRDMDIVVPEAAKAPGDYADSARSTVLDWLGSSE